MDGASRIRNRRGAGDPRQRRGPVRIPSRRRRHRHSATFDRSRQFQRDRHSRHSRRNLSKPAARRQENAGGPKWQGDLPCLVFILAARNENPPMVSSRVHTRPREIVFHRQRPALHWLRRTDPRRKAEKRRDDQPLPEAMDARAPSQPRVCRDLASNPVNSLHTREPHLAALIQANESELHRQWNWAVYAVNQVFAR